MMRWFGIVAVSAGLTLGACGSSEKKSDTPSGPTYTDRAPEEALIGRWSDGSNTISFESGGSYRWEEARACGSPPCPTTASSGRWTLRSGKIYLDPSEGGDEIVEFGFMDNQTGLSLSSAKQGKNWTLRKQ